MGTKAKTYSFSTVVDGYMMALGARRLSQNTIDDYTRTLAKFAAFLGEDLPVHEINVRDIERFLGSNEKLSNKTILNYHVGLSGLWNWMVQEELVPENVVRKLKPPKPQKKEVIPFTEQEVKAMMAVLNRSKVYIRQGQSVDHSLITFERNRAILLLMLDTGLRATELCDLKIEDVDNRNNRIFVKQGKGMKERLLPFSPRTGQMVWRYLAGRKAAQPGDPLFTGRLNRPLTRTKLAEMFSGIGKRAGVPNVHPHRFRHTFAIQFLRNGGNAYTLQMMLGHSSFESVRIYLRLAQIDVDQAHRKASPVDGWRL